MFYCSYLDTIEIHTYTITRTCMHITCRRILNSWGMELLTFLGLTDHYAQSLTHRLFRSAEKNNLPLVTYFREELDNLMRHEML